MAERRESINVDVKGAAKAERDLDRIGDAFDNVADEITELARANRRGELSSEKLGRELQRLGADARVASRHVKALDRDLDRLARKRGVPGLPGGGGGGGIGRGVLDLFGSAGSKLGPGGAAIGGAALAGAPFLGAVTGAAGILGAGLGAAAGGAAISATRNDDVQASFGGLGRKVSDRAGISADAAFAKPLIQAAATLDKSFDAVADDMDRIFKASSKLIDPLTKGVGGFVERLAPGFEKAVVAGEKLADVLGDELPQLGASVGDMFDSFASGSEGAAEGLKDLLEITGTALRGFGNIVEGLSDIYDQAVKFRELNPITSRIFGDHFEGEARSIGAAGEDALDQIAGASTRAAKETGRLNDEFDKLFGILMTTDQAAIEYQSAVDDLTASFKKNGDTIDINTEKGRNNLEAVNDVIGAIEETRDAAIRAGDGSRAATDAANAAYVVQLTNLRQQLKALGLNTTAVDALIAKYEELAKPQTKVFTVKIVEVGASDALGGKSSSGQRRFFAAGGRYQKGQPRVVGEQGPEIDIPDHAGFIANAATVQRMIGSGSAGSPVGGASIASATRGGEVVHRLIVQNEDGVALFDRILNHPRGPARIAYALKFMNRVGQLNFQTR